MNISATHFEDNLADFSFARTGSTHTTESRPARRREDGRRRRRAPQQFNGIHRRRRKKIRW